MATKKEPKPVIDKMLKLLDEADTRTGEPPAKRKRPMVAKSPHKFKDGISYSTRVIDGITVKSAAGFTSDERVLKAKILSSRGGIRQERAPQEWRDLAKNIRDEQKAMETPKFREAAYTLFIAELKKRYPQDKRIDLISMDVFKRTYLKRGS